MKNALLRPVLTGAVSSVYDLQVRAPDGNPAHSVHIAGPDPHRILILGNGPSTGLGVLSHELGLPGQLGRRIAAATGRGVDVELVSRIRLLARATEGLVGNIDLRRFDAIVLTIGYSESVRLTSISRWRRELTSLLDRIERNAAPGLQVFLLAARAFVPHPEFRAAFARPANAHMSMINAAAREVLRTRDRATFLDAAPEIDESFFEHTARSYERWAEAVTPSIVPLLGATRASASETDEKARQEALDELGILDTPPEDRFDRYTRLAVDLLGMRGAAVTFIDRDREWIKSIAGVSAPQSTPRSEAFCDITIRSHELLVVEDATVDTRFMDRPSVRMHGGVRFYAGYPLEARNGQRVGAFCVLDTRPRRFSRADQALLRDLAIKVQTNLWELAEAS